MAADQKDQRRFKKILNTVQSGFNNVQSSIQSSMQRQGNSTFYTATIQQQRSLKSGWLKKQGGVVKSWHKRWFTIKGDHMYYFATDDESKPPLGFIFLPGNKVIEHPFSPTDPEKNSFEIQPGGEKNRMTSTHETYPLCANDDEDRKEWVRIIRRVMYAEKGGAIFGQSLEETMRYESRFNRKIPEIVEMCVEYLTNQGLETEGIFRLPGRTSVIRQLREKFDCGERPNFEDTDADFNTVASLLKQYLRELPEPIIPARFYEVVMKAVIRDMPTKREEGIESLSYILQSMPTTNYNLLQYLSRFLFDVSQMSGRNKMTETNLATVFAQCVIKPEDEDPALLMGTAGNRSQVVLVLIRHHTNIFKMEYTLGGASVMVDNLLDIGDNTSNNSFDVETMPYYQVPKSTSLEKDLLGIDIGASSMDENLPEPIFPAASTERVSNHSNQNGLYDSGSHEEDVYYSAVVSQSCYDEVEEVEEEGEEEEDWVDLNEEPVFGSVRASVLQGDIQPVGVQMRQNLKPTPVPPPRHSKQKGAPSTTSVTSLDSTMATQDSVVTEDDNDDDALLQSLYDTRLDDLSEPDVRDFVDRVLAELKSQRSKVKDLQNHVQTLKQKHKRDIHDMSEKIHQEREATANAVDKVMKVQSQLQEYQMRFSGIE